MIHTDRFTFKQIFKDYPWTVGIIFFSIVVTVISVVVTLAVWMNDQETEDLLGTFYQLEGSYYQIHYLDDILTKSTTLYILTGNDEYKARHNKEKKVLVKSLSHAQQLSGMGNKDIESVKRASTILIALEEKAFRLYDKGNKSEALEVLQSATYRSEKIKYDQSIGIAVREKKKEIQQELAEKARMEIILFGILIFTVFFYILSWIIFVLLVTRYSRDFKFRVDRSLRDLSHDMRDPISSMISYSQLLINEMDGPINEKQKDSILRIQSTGKRLLAVIKDVLSFSNLQSEKIQIELEEIDGAKLIHDCVGGLIPLADLKGVKLSTEVSSTNIFMKTDSAKLIQIIDNLVANAIKYTDEGTICVKGDVLVDRLQIQVVDTGRGIPERYLQKIFKPFFQVIKGKKEGLGLGLAITSQLVTALGGTIAVESVAGQGSTFTISLPINGCYARIKKNE